MRPDAALFVLMTAAVPLAAASAGAQGSEALRAHIPFTFQAGRTELPPGDYNVTFDDSDHILRVTGVTSPKGALLLTNTEEPPRGSHGDPKLVFDHAGDTYTLREVVDPGDGFGVRVPAAKHGREEVKRTEVPLQRPGQAAASNGW
jgi:hypothetical protein